MRIPLNSPTFDDLELKDAIDVLRSGMVTMGSKCFEFEDAFARYIGSKHAVFVNSGSSANLLAFFALANPQLPAINGKRKLCPGDEVIVPALTWATTIWPIVQAGGIPVLVDCDPMTLQMRVELVEQAITPKTVAICPAHILGNSVPLSPLLALAKKHKLWVIEDTCESLGSEYSGKKLGTFGDMGTYSFFFAHHITTIEGGMIVTDNDELADLLRCLRAHGWTRHLKNRKEVEAKHPEIDPRFLFVNTGFNLRPTEINAAFGLQQLKKLNDFNASRIRIADQWSQAFGSLIQAGELRIMKTTPETLNTWFGYPTLCKDRETKQALQSWLEENGIETRPIIAGNLARQPAFKHIEHRVHGTLAGADEAMDCGLYWGTHPLMTPTEMSYVSQKVKEFFSQRGHR